MPFLAESTMIDGLEGMPGRCGGATAVKLTYMLPTSRTVVSERIFEDTVHSMQTVIMMVVQAGRAEEAGTAEARHRTPSERLPQHSGMILGAARDNHSKSCHAGPALHLHSFAAPELHLSHLSAVFVCRRSLCLYLCTAVAQAVRFQLHRKSFSQPYRQPCRGIQHTKWIQIFSAAEAKRYKERSRLYTVHENHNVRYKSALSFMRLTLHLHVDNEAYNTRLPFNPPHESPCPSSVAHPRMPTR